METNNARVFIRTPDALTFREVELPAALEAGTEVRIGVPVPDNVTYVTSRTDTIGQAINARRPEHGDDMLEVATRIVDGKAQFASDGLRSEDV